MYTTTKSIPTAEQQTEQFNQITKIMLDTYIRKNHDYGNAFDKGNDKYGIVSGISRIDEKMERVNTLYLHPEDAMVAEDLTETLLDMANYCIMMVMYIRNKTRQD